MKNLYFFLKNLIKISYHEFSTLISVFFSNFRSKRPSGKILEVKEYRGHPRTSSATPWVKSHRPFTAEITTPKISTANMASTPPERRTRATKFTSRTPSRLKPRARALMTDLSSTVFRTREISRWTTNSQELMTAPLLFCVEMVRTLVNIISQSTEWFTFKKSTNGFKPDVKQKMVLLKINGSCYCA